MRTFVVQLQEAQASGKLVFDVEQLTHGYGGTPLVRALSLRVMRGDRLALLGPNGAGKTTSFYCVTGLISPDHGRIFLDGQDITALPMYRRARLGISGLLRVLHRRHALRFRLCDAALHHCWIFLAGDCLQSKCPPPLQAFGNYHSASRFTFYSLGFVCDTSIALEF